MDHFPHGPRGARYQATPASSTATQSHDQAAPALDSSGSPASPSDGSELRPLAAAAEAHRPKPRTIVYLDPTDVLINPAINPRAYAQLNATNCAELLAMLAAVGQQQPVLVRRVEVGGRTVFELVAGSRRHWCVVHHRVHDHPDMLLAAEVIDVDDREAARRADAENRGRASISFFERALFVAHQLKHVYAGVQADLAADMKIDAGLLSRLISVSTWVPNLLGAFGDPLRITAEDAVAIAPLWRRDNVTSHRLVSAAGILADEQEKRRLSGKAYLKPAQIRRQLVASVKDQPERCPIHDANGEVIVEVRQTTRNGMCIYIRESNRARQQETLDAIVATIKSLRGRQVRDDGSPIAVEL